MGGQRHAPAALPPEKTPVPIVQDVGWALRPVWTDAENLAPHRDSIPDRRYTDSDIPAADWQVLPTLKFAQKTWKSPRPCDVFNKVCLFIFASYLIDITGLRLVGQPLLQPSLYVRWSVGKNRIIEWAGHLWPKHNPTFCTESITFIIIIIIIMQPHVQYFPFTNFTSLLSDIFLCYCTHKIEFPPTPSSNPTPPPHGVPDFRSIRTNNATILSARRRNYCILHLLSNNEVC